MKWVYPQFLFALAVLIIPLLIHLFHFKRYKTVYFSSLSFLKSIEQEQRSVRKLKRWLIFAARAFAFTFFVFAFAQPYFSVDDQKEQFPLLRFTWIIPFRCRKLDLKVNCYHKVEKSLGLSLKNLPETRASFS